MRDWSKQVQVISIQAPQIVPVHGDAAAIEEFQNLDCDLAAVRQSITELSSCERASLGVSKVLTMPIHLQERLASLMRQVRSLSVASRARCLTVRLCRA